MIIPHPQADINKHLPIEALTQLIITLNQKSVASSALVDFSSTRSL